jgi:transcriptional regulator GlxA family with amidase domain
VKKASADAEVTMSVCTGAFLLAKAGLLDGKEATTHWASVERLKSAAPNITVRADRRFVDTGKVITTAGVSAGIDGALHVVKRLLGEQAAKNTARYMEYRWDGAP